MSSQGMSSQGMSSQGPPMRISDEDKSNESIANNRRYTTLWVVEDEENQNVEKPDVKNQNVENQNVEKQNVENVRQREDALDGILNVDKYIYYL